MCLCVSRLYRTRWKYCNCNWSKGLVPSFRNISARCWRRRNGMNRRGWRVNGCRLIVKRSEQMSPGSTVFCWLKPSPTRCRPLPMPWLVWKNGCLFSWGRFKLMSTSLNLCCEYCLVAFDCVSSRWHDWYQLVTFAGWLSSGLSRNDQESFLKWEESTSERIRRRTLCWPILWLLQLIRYSLCDN